MTSPKTGALGIYHLLGRDANNVDVVVNGIVDIDIARVVDVELAIAIDADVLNILKGELGVQRWLDYH